MARRKVLEPCGHRVIVRPEPVEEVTAGGIILTASEHQKKLEKAGTSLGTIIKIGPTAWKAFDGGLYRWAEVGDKVYYAKYGGIFVVDPITEEEFVVLNDEDIVLVIETDVELPEQEIS